MGTSSPRPVLTGQQRIASLAKEAPSMSFTTLAHHMDMGWLREAFRLTRKDGAVGIDGQTAQDYESKLDDNLAALLKRAKTGTYRAPPVKRVHIPKGDGGKETRPIGVPAFEDKVLQRAIVMLLEPIYEHDFLDCSYGFRPGRSAHQALQAVWDAIMSRRGGYVLEVDIRKFFDTLVHPQLRELLSLRVRDGVVRRLIDKWLKAGVMDHGELSYPEAGTPQGGVVSPLAANVYLHYVLDVWFETEVKPRLSGNASLIRYCDDFVIVFSQETDAIRVAEVLPKRFSKFGLTLHPEKTRLLAFNRPPMWAREPTKEQGVFDFLGFTHYWGRSRKGHWVVKRGTAKGRLKRAVKKTAQWCRANRHRSIKEQQKALSAKLLGHYGYYGITGNMRNLARYYRLVTGAWRKWLERRSQRGKMPWDRFKLLLKRYPLPYPRVVHSIYDT